MAEGMNLPMSFFFWKLSQVEAQVWISFAIACIRSHKRLLMDTPSMPQSSAASLLRLRKVDELGVAATRMLINRL